jgi:hypothetical protein
VNIANSSTAVAGVLVSSGQQQVGGIDGAGNVQVNSNASLIANHITAGVLAIGGSSGNPAVVKIAASDAGGGPLGEEGGLAVAATLVPSSPFAAGIGSPSSGLTATDLTPGGQAPASIPLALNGERGSASASAVPEPASQLLLLLGVGAFFVFTCLQARRSVPFFRRHPKA